MLAEIDHAVSRYPTQCRESNKGTSTLLSVEVSQVGSQVVTGQLLICCTFGSSVLAALGAARGHTYKHHAARLAVRSKLIIPRLGPQKLSPASPQIRHDVRRKRSPLISSLPFFLSQLWKVRRIPHPSGHLLCSAVAASWYPSRSRTLLLFLECD